MARTIVLIHLVFLVLLGCQQQFPQKGLWSGTIELADSVHLPFSMHLDLSSPAPSGYFLVSTEQTPIPEIQQKDDSLFFFFSEYGGVMKGRWDGNQIIGTYTRFRADTTSMTFYASYDERTPTNTGSTKQTSVLPVGRHMVYFQKNGKLDSNTVAHFWLSRDTLYGTFIAPDGDYGLLVGTPLNSHVQFNRFTGWQAIVLDMQQHGGQWSGTYYLWKNQPRAFTLRPLTTLGQALTNIHTTSKIDPHTPFVFSGITIEGDTLEHNDERFKGKIVLVDIMGTWCHNCMDAAPLLQRLYEEFNADGLEIVGLSFENSADTTLGKKNLSLYQQRYGMTFPLLFCGSTEEANVEKRIRSQLRNFFAYPTTLFIDRRGRVYSIHVGFKGPGAGEEYQEQVEEYYKTVRALLKKK